MSHHIHSSNTKHGGVHIISMEHMIHVMIFFLLIIKNFFFSFFFQIFSCCNQKSGGSTCRITDNLITGRIHHLNHHPDNMSWCTELSIPSGLGYFRKEIFIYVSSDICCLDFIHKFVNFIQRIHHFG